MNEREEREYLIPANSKKSLLIFNIFRPIDLLIFAVGAVLTLLLLLTISDNTFKSAIFKLLPLLISLFLVLPIPNYHNTLVFIREIYQYYSNRRIYLWKGWCVSDGAEK